MLITRIIQEHVRRDHVLPAHPPVYMFVRRSENRARDCREGADNYLFNIRNIMEFARALSLTAAGIHSRLLVLIGGIEIIRNFLRERFFFFSFIILEYFLSRDK